MRTGKGLHRMARSDALGACLPRRSPPGPSSLGMMLEHHQNPAPLLTTESSEEAEPMRRECSGAAAAKCSGYSRPCAHRHPAEPARDTRTQGPWLAKAGSPSRPSLVPLGSPREQLEVWIAPGRGPPPGLGPVGGLRLAEWGGRPVELGPGGSSPERLFGIRDPNGTPGRQPFPLPVHSGRPWPDASP